MRSNPQETLRISLVQADLAWESSVANIARFRSLLQHLKGTTDLVMLPEMFNTAFTTRKEMAEPMEGKAAGFIQEMALYLDCLLCASIFTNDHGRLFNRFFCFYPDGSFLVYDKRHLFRLSQEVDILSAGEKTVIVPWKGWNIMPLVCYDLRFPVWSRNSYRDGEYRYDLLLYTANWPVGRAEAWKALLVARAMENQAYVAGVNRVGEDGNGLVYAGESMIIDPSGSITGFGKKNTEMIVQVSVSMTALNNHRESFPFGQDWDRFQLLP